MSDRSRAPRGDGGAASVMVLALLFFFAALSMGIGAILSSGLAMRKAALGADEGRKELFELAEGIARNIAMDSSPEADSRHDDAWLKLEALPEGVFGFIDDVSSGINPNWIRRGMLENTAFGTYLERGATSTALQAYRAEKGLSTEIGEWYRAFFNEDALRDKLKPYGYANLNSTDEFALARLYRDITGDAVAAEGFRKRIQSLILSGKVLLPGDEAEFLGAEASRLYPGMTAEAPINANFADPLIVTELIRYPDYEVADQEYAIRAILDERTSTELDAPRLREILGKHERHPIFTYLGVRTWFWRITTMKTLPDGRTEKCWLVYARYPGREGGLTIVGRGYE